MASHSTYVFHSMKFRLIGLGLALMCAGMLFRLLYALPVAQQLLRDLVSTQQMSIASYVARDIDHSILARRALIGALGAALPQALLQQPGQLAQWLSDRQRDYPLFDHGLIVLRPDGSGLLAEYPVVSGRARLDFASAAWVQAALLAEAPVMSKPLRWRADGEPVLIMAVPLRDAARRVVALLAGVAVLNGPGFLDRLQEIQVGTGGGLLLVSPADRMFVGASDPSMRLKPTPAPGVNLLHDRAMAGFRGTDITSNARGELELSSIAAVPSSGWFVVARMPLAEVFYPIDAMRTLFWKNTIVMTIAMIALLAFLLPRILRPLTQAAAAMREMADERRELAPLPVRCKDEVGDLLAGFNHLVTRLREKEAALKASEARLAYMAHHDPLTGLYNRLMFESRAQQVLAHAERNASHFAILFCDLDHFKQINDQLGHAAGDAILWQVAARLLDGRRQTDTVARLGGDEFVILLTDLVDARATAVSVVQQILAAISAPFDLEGRSLTVGVSIGIALYCGARVSISQLMSQADSAMYQAKREGTTGFRVFDEACLASIAEREGECQGQSGVTLLGA